ncbi:hypothetical protein [Chitinophaga arvensicola]|uniref:Uncharacterized protein n=1 Tax=Chitinophaga arvensicola TaxID=29529 RepID=A0A1I0R3U5_9BACT|nr:hypothetical protein [Chitinophaga arvensicola]SEW34937.1 hypothetical protein SAMN04488122_2165 [Chitinophaga arvensicola]
MKKLIIFILGMSLFVMGCNKKELALPSPAVIKLTLQGYSLGDTLEALKGKEVIATLRANSSFSTIALITINDDQQKIDVRKKGATDILGSFEVGRTPFSQTKRIFFDGKTVQDKMEVTPVTNPANTGFRIKFQTDFPYFYGGAVDFIVWQQSVDMNTYEYTFTKMQEIKNVGSAFSGFIELPGLVSTDQIWNTYVFKVFKTGTTELPYTDEADVSGIQVPEYNFGIMDNMKAGESKLFLVRPYYTGNAVGESYEVEDISYFFR